MQPYSECHWVYSAYIYLLKQQHVIHYHQRWMYVNAHWTKSVPMAFGLPWSSLFLFFSTTRCCSLQFSAKQEIHSHLQHHKSAPVKLGWGGGHRIISKLLTGEISETSINYNNSLLKTFTQKFCHNFFLSSCGSKPVWHTWCLWNGMSISKQQFRWTICFKG